MRGLARFLMLAAVAMSIGMAGCAGTGTAYVGVYGPAVYGPAYGGAWGGYRYPGRYPPYGGGWVGVPICCYEQEEQQQDLQQETLFTWAPDLRDGEDGPPVPFDLPRIR